MTEYLNYQKFSSNDEALLFIKLVKANNIRFKVEDTSQIFDPAMANNKHEMNVIILVHADDFSKLDTVLENQSELSLDDFDKEHYLFNFSEDELIDILKKSDEWSLQDRILARLILEKKQIIFSEEQLTTWKNDRYKLLEIEKIKNNLGSHNNLISVLSEAREGFDTWQQKEVLPDGTKVPVANESERKNGLLKFAIAAVIAIIILLFKIFNRIH